MNNPGHPTVLTPNEEEKIVEAIITAADWGYPFENEDIKLLVKNYLDRAGKSVKCFTNNMPGHDWYHLFVARHQQQLKVRMCENIKRSRAAVTRAAVNQFFDNIDVTLKDVPPENLVNYDETCFVDDPGKVKVVVRRKCKHPERVMDSTKSTTSVMFAVTASGHMLPPYIVYKSEHIWSTWTERGPEGCRYNRSKSGWFDQCTFEDWFFSLLLPYMKKYEGPKVLIGDNLASHLSESVIAACRENNIRFTFLPPNSTHLMQPLDVSCFRPMKAAWRKVLKAWKKNNKGPLRKDLFPNILKRTLEKLETKNADNIKSGFRASGLSPIDRAKVLDKLPPEETDNSTTLITESVVSVLKEARYGTQKEPKASKKKKITVEAGRSVCSGTIENDTYAGPSTTPEVQQAEVSFQEESESEPEQTEDGDNMDENDNITYVEDISEDDFVLVKYTTDRGNMATYVGRVISKTDIGVKCKFLRQTNKDDQIYVYPQVDDVDIVTLHQIVKKCKLKASRRGRYSFETF